MNPFNGGYRYNPFVLKLASTGAYVWHTFIGYHDNGGDTANAVAVDGNGNVYVSGSSTTGWNGPGVCETPGSPPCPRNGFSIGSEPYGSTNIYVFKLSSTGVYQWHTFYGAGTWNGYGAYGLALDNSGNIYATGWSSTSWNGPGTCSTPGTSPCPLNAFSEYSDIFVLKLTGSGEYQWHTFYGSGGGNGNISGRGIAINGTGDVYVSGMSWVTWNGPNTTPPLNPDGDFVILKLTGSGAYQWHTFYGPGGNYVYGLAIHGGSDVYVTGLSESSWNGPSNTSPLHDFNAAANYNLFILKLNDTAGAVVPSVTTAAVTSINQTTATGGGNVTADGGATVTTRGVCWSTSANPIRTGNHTTDNSGIGPFTSAISGLSPYTTYHVRAYATNTAGTAYGDDLYFTTPCPDYVAYIGATGHGTLQGAIDSVVGAAEIRAVAGERQGALTISGNKVITFLGGYDCVCGAVIGVTSVHGSLTVGASASVAVSNVAVY